MDTSFPSPDLPMDPNRRHWVVLTAATGGVGTVFTAVPFVSSFAPSERAKAAGGPVEDLPPTASADRHFTARFRGGLVRNLDQMKQAQSTGALQIVDARAAARFRGEVDEPRAGLARGHIPGALNVPYTTLLQEDGRFKSPEAIAAIFGNAGVNLAKPIVNTCGSGVTAAILALAEAIAGNEMAAVYDASWCEWGAPDTGAPIATA